jgi:hypothetical protein
VDADKLQKDRVSDQYRKSVWRYVDECAATSLFEWELFQIQLDRLWAAGTVLGDQWVQDWFRSIEEPLNHRTKDYTQDDRYEGEDRRRLLDGR